MLEKGFTLIEVMIVVVILAGVAVIGISQFGRNNNQIKAAVRKVSVLSKELHNAARMNNRIYRMVLQMDEEKGYGIWVESAAKGQLLTKDSFSEEIKTEEEKKEQEEENPSPFARDGSVLKKPISIPSPVLIKEVEISGLESSITKGLAYIYFLPQGMTQASAIHLSDNNQLNWTIVINPITGQSKIVTEDRPLKELKTE